LPDLLLPQIVKAMKDQADRIALTSRAFYNGEQALRDQSPLSLPPPSLPPHALASVAVLHGDLM